MHDFGLLNLATYATARFTSKSLNYSVFDLFRTLNLLRIWPSMCTESCDISITKQNRCVADISATCSQVAAVCSCLLSVLPVSYKNRQCNVSIEPNQPEFISIYYRFCAVDRPFVFSLLHKWVHFNLPGSSPTTVLQLQGGKGVGGCAVVPVMLRQLPTMVQLIPPLLSSRGNQKLNLQEVMHTTVERQHPCLMMWHTFN